MTTISKSKLARSLKLLCIFANCWKSGFLENYCILIFASVVNQLWHHRQCISQGQPAEHGDRERKRREDRVCLLSQYDHLASDKLETGRNLSFIIILKLTVMGCIYSLRKRNHHTTSYSRKNLKKRGWREGGCLLMVHYIFLACYMIIYTKPPGLGAGWETKFCSEDFLEEHAAVGIKNHLIWLVEGEKIRLF